MFAPYECLNEKYIEDIIHDLIHMANFLLAFIACCNELPLKLIRKLNYKEDKFLLNANSHNTYACLQFQFIEYFVTVKDNKNCDNDEALLLSKCFEAIRFQLRVMKA